MYRLTLFCALGIHLMLLFMACPLSAEDEDNQARLQFEEGIRLFKDGDFEGASIAFNRAYELRPSYKILYNVGQVESELKHYCLALAAYSEYLSAGGDEVKDDRRTEVEGHVTRLKIRVGSVEIKYGRDGTTVLIDEERQGITPVTEAICVDMGTHDLSLREGVEEIYRESFRIAGGQTLTLDLDSKSPKEAAPPVEPPVTEVEPSAPVPAAEPSRPASEPTAQVTKNATTDETPTKGKRKWTWVALGLGGALGATGAIVGGISMSKESSLKGRCENYVCDSSEQDAKDSISRMNLAADICFGAAGAAAVAGIILFFIEPRRQETPKVALVPQGAPGRFGVSIEGRF